MSQKEVNNNQFMINHPVSIEQTPRWIRIKFGGKIIADSKSALLLLEYGPGRLPTYYFPRENVQMEFLEDTDYKKDGPAKKYWNIKVGDKFAEHSAYSWVNPPSNQAALKNYISFKWHKMDAWLEESEEVFVHARDPHKRVDVIKSSRNLRVVKDGVEIVNTREPYLLFETNLPTRYYVPRNDVNMDFLVATKTHSRCPYKGIADYWSIKIGDVLYKDLVWSYPDPIPENPKIKDLLCFFNEKVDIYLDGELQPRPITPWS